MDPDSHGQVPQSQRVRGLCSPSCRRVQAQTHTALQCGIPNHLMGMSEWSFLKCNSDQARNVHSFRSSLTHEGLTTLHLSPFWNMYPIIGVKQCSQPHIAVSNALYHLRLGTPILTSVQATANFLTFLVAPANTRWQVFFGPDTHTVLLQ